MATARSEAATANSLVPTGPSPHSLCTLWCRKFLTQLLVELFQEHI